MLYDTRTDESLAGEPVEFYTGMDAVPDVRPGPGLVFAARHTLRGSDAWSEGGAVKKKMAHLGPLVLAGRRPGHAAHAGRRDGAGDVHVEIQLQGQSASPGGGSNGQTGPGSLAGVGRMHGRGVWDAAGMQGTGPSLRG